MADSKRVGIQHIQALKPLEFIELLKHFEDELGGVLRAGGTKMTLKVDGSPFRFGMTSAKKFFVETGKSGLLYDDSEVQAAIDNFTSTPKVADLFGRLSKMGGLQKALERIVDEYGHGVKFIGDVIYVPKAIADGDRLRFVVVTYDRKKLGEVATIVNFLAVGEDGNKMVDSDKLIKQLKAESNGTINFDDPHIDMDDVDVNLEIKDLKSVLSQYGDVKALLSSRNQPVLKAALETAIQEVKERIAGKLVAAVKDTKFGDEFEGVVLELASGKQLKATTDLFKAKKAEKFGR